MAVRNGQTWVYCMNGLCLVLLGYLGDGLGYGLYKTEPFTEEKLKMQENAQTLMLMLYV